MNGQLKFDSDLNVVCDNDIQKINWGYQLSEKAVFRATVILHPDEHNKLAVCPMCGCLFKYLGQKYCGGCGSEFKVYNDDKYFKFLDKLKEGN